MITHEISEFGNRMGISNLEFSQEGILAFEIENTGSLYLEKDQQGEELFIYLSTPSPQYDTDIPKKVLEICSYKNANTFILHGGVYNDTIILLTHINFREVTASLIENITQFLIETTQKVL